MDFKAQKIYGMPPGVDFPKLLVDGICDHFSTQPPQNLARVHIIVNTERMYRRIQILLSEKTNILHPKIHSLTNLQNLLTIDDTPRPLSSLASRLELISLMDKFLKTQPDIAPRSSIYSLSDSLLDLIDEMSDEQVEASDIASLDISDVSGHWERTRNFLMIVYEYLEARKLKPDKTYIRRIIIEKLVKQWAQIPPSDPIILAGSTGSRGTTFKLMKAIYNLPQGALILPGFDFDMRHENWKTLSKPNPKEDHPQYRFCKFLGEIRCTPHQVSMWPNSHPPCQDRNKLFSLTLRPAPVTDSWLSEGPKLGSLRKATEDIVVLEAETSREEAFTIALRLKEAFEKKQSAALISPDRRLTRQVSAALDRWNITPDDSAGIPFNMTKSGRFLRQILKAISGELRSSDLIATLKHPFTCGENGRDEHLRFTIDLEIFLRQKSVYCPDKKILDIWSKKINSHASYRWSQWISEFFLSRKLYFNEKFEFFFEHHINVAEMITLGSNSNNKKPKGILWNTEEGHKLEELISSIKEAASYGHLMSPKDYANIFEAILLKEQLHIPIETTSGIFIWGALEARVNGTELVVIGGLNDGVWPQSLQPDAWLNRSLRKKVGLRSPDNQIGLAAHDFQQAATAKEVWLTRAKKVNDSETIPSRWLNRLKKLLNGLKKNNGPQVLKSMQNRARYYQDLAKKIETPEPVAPTLRPSPCPPINARPQKLRVTEIRTLIRDPYTIYARHILRLKPLENFNSGPNSRLRGEIFHKIFEKFIARWNSIPVDKRQEIFQEIATQVLSDQCPWLAVRILWKAQIEALSDWFLATEKIRQSQIVETFLEKSGTIIVPDSNVTLIGRADRIHLLKDGKIAIYDYKTGNIPTGPQQIYFEKQLLLLSAMAEYGAFPEVPRKPVLKASYIGLGATLKELPAPFEEENPGQAWKNFKALISSYLDFKKGYTARRALFRLQDVSEFDQLSRFGEWQITQKAKLELLK